VLNFLVVALLIALVGQGWNVLGGYGGQYSFGHAAFFGTAAYTTGILQLRYGVNAAAVPSTPDGLSRGRARQDRYFPDRSRARPKARSDCAAARACAGPARSLGARPRWRRARTA